MSTAETTFSLKPDTPSIEQVLIQALVTAGWKSSLMRRNKIATQPVTKTVSAGGLSFVGSFSAVCTWNEGKETTNVLVVVSEIASSAPALSATCAAYCNDIVAAIPPDYLFKPGRS